VWLSDLPSPIAVTADLLENVHQEEDSAKSDFSFEKSEESAKNT
jgi:hypothetical protein